MVKVMAESRVAANSRARGLAAEEGELGSVTGQIRRVLSCSFQRAQALCLIAQLRQVGPGARGAADKRAAAKRAEFARQQEAVGVWLPNVRGRGANRSGMVFVP